MIDCYSEVVLGRDVASVHVIYTSFHVYLVVFIYQSFRREDSTASTEKNKKANRIYNKLQNQE